MRCIQVHDIASISGAQEYSDVATVPGRHLARFSLAEFERRLDPTRFLQMHRSGIVNLDYFDRAEPAGSGCFLLTVRNGETVRASRQGARKLRAAVLTNAVRTPAFEDPQPQAAYSAACNPAGNGFNPIATRYFAYNACTLAT